MPANAAHVAALAFPSDAMHFLKRDPLLKFPRSNLLKCALR